MDVEQLRDYCLSKPGASEGLPFGDDVLVFKVVGKVFALTNIETFPSTVNLKCDPERAVTLRADYEGVAPGYHMNKKHWNTITLESDLDEALLYELVDHSYELVVQKLTRAQRQSLTEA